MHFSRVFVFLSTLAAVSTTPAPAVPLSLTEPSDDSLYLLDDYIVEFRRTTYNQKAPAVTHQLTADDLAALNLPETGDALQHLPNLFIRKRFVGDKNALTSIRGTSNRQPGRTVVIADGIVLSNFLGTGFGNSPRWFLVAPEEVEKIAVSYGPYSSLYAGNSIGGTVLFTTKQPAAFHASVKGQLLFHDFSEYGTRETLRGHTAYLSLGDRRGGFSWFAFYNHLKNDGHPQTFNTITRAQTAAADSVTSFTSVTGAIHDSNSSGAPWIVYGSAGPIDAVHDLFKFKLGYDGGDALHLRYTVAYWSNSEDNLAPETYLHDASGTPIWSGRVETAGRVFTIPANAFTLSARRQADLIHGLTFAHDPSEGFQFTFTGSLYDVVKDNTWASDGSAPAARISGTGQATLIGDTGWKTADVLLGWRTADGLLAAHAPVLGFHFDTYFTEQEQRSLAEWRDHDSLAGFLGGNGGRTTTRAFFFQDTWRINDRWSLTPGIRHERWHASDGYQANATARGLYPQRRASAWSPKLALTWKPDRNWSARLSLARATRFPTVGELFQGTVTANGSVTQNNLDLKPERDFAKDLTFERNLSHGSARLSFFEEDVRDSLVNQTTLRDDGTSLSGPQNVGRVLTRGAEFAIRRHRFLHDSIDFDFNASWTNSIIKENAPILVGGSLVDTVGKRFPRIPRWQVKSVVTWRATPRLSLSAAARYSSDQYNTLENSDRHGGYGGTDSFLVVDLRATWRIRDGLTASLGADNVGDERYHVFHPMPGRTFIAEASWKL